METLLHDVRYGLRMLQKNPGFTAVAVLTLALGIGANTAIFSVIYAVLLRPLGFSEPGRLVTMWERDKTDPISNTSYATFRDWQGQNHSFERLAVMSSWLPILSGETGAERVPGLRVTQDFFQILRVRPLYGRDFLTEEDRRGNHRVVILSYGLWQRRFGGDREIVGKSIPVFGLPYTVVGILPANFEPVFDSFNEPAQIWAPLAYDTSLPWACRTCRHLQAVGRLKPGVSLAQASAEMDTISSTLVRDYPTDYSASGTVLIPLHEQVVGRARVALYVLWGAVLLVLLIACTNVASLLLSRATQRGREMAVRIALGASRGRLIRQLLTESILLFAVGGALGLGLAVAALRLLLAINPGNIPRMSGVGIDPAALTFALAISLISGLVFGLAPALHTTHRAPIESLKDGGTSSAGMGRQRLRAAFVASNVALALMLLLGAGLLLRSLGRVLSVDPGFQPNRILTASIDVAGPKYSEDPEVIAFFEQVLEQVRSLPGVGSAGVTSQLPLGGNVDSYGVHIEGKISSNPELDPSADRYAISPDYLRTMGIPILRGRGFDERDRVHAPQVVLVNQALAQRMWPNENPLGARLKVGGLDDSWRTVVGVVGDVLHASLEAPHTSQVYLPVGQWRADSNMVLVVKTAGPPLDMAKAVTNAVAAVDKNQPVSKIAAMEQVVASSVGQRRFTLWLLCLFALTAVVLAAIGVYGVVSYFVVMRHHEIGLRMALGARPSDVLELVLRHGLKLVLAGVAFGILGGAASGRVLSSLLYQVSPNDPTTLAAVALLLVGIALLASYIPALRATKVDPMVALRYE